MSILDGKHILLGVTGSIAAYKAAELASRMTQAGAHVDLILTRAAERFISPLTFQSLTGRKAYTDSELWGGESHILHVGLGHAADLLLIAPCTANTITKLAQGQANDLLSITALAAQCPILIAPAMDVGMYEHPATQENVRILKERSVHFAGPAAGRMASGLSGYGRMLEPDEITGHTRGVLGLRAKLAGKKIVITAGGTQEPIDPVRFISNRSSGKQGYALAQAGIDMGADVTLISAPTALTPPIGANLILAQTAEEMLDAVLTESAGADALIMAAAIADFRPAETALKKLKKRDGIPQITLEAAPDVLKTVANLNSRAKRPRVVVGFAAESRDLLANASEKLSSKKLDMIVANDISTTDAGFDVENNRVTLLYPDGKQEKLSLRTKFDVAEIILERIDTLIKTLEK
ncbi:MAG: bifunctional phosphopantothenoylcysteine decarboxylase/phosphopantothenate--cysteine ligase CoaBC [Anaerolineae bacterium]|jgi:phosphopantothenoylcysteine decarboxylase/phosphopantothenate--cysteine ligase|nr:bifunctional phosphopantothenoylcysteine decarboxylase/phosphopantothenate--cysteine ligase CoaBC [Anaerolineae bacterium]MBT3713470.1 bifunctional phosphopantothenoylcysteine decarboxylase/phosphopantothenate--cysteine ligase CoaBC [Anaerolineae bacterium]MBT4310990.1 bifunctional phosphopantothenoylcysteine decarboxylase/phosphopantothenate--cysteine ligase CoaBC [Anaerolineae bacterium]MBT4459720.1 bifunctional phosphopantothenoylcysteine decarboxylase/phosphopantothenate--cysteine ligase 